MNLIENSNRPVHGWLPKVPSIYQIEVCSRCNFNCEFCLTGLRGGTSEKGLIDPKLFQTIVKRDLSGSKFIELQFRGEPTLNKNLAEYVKMLKPHVLVGFSTHGGLLSTKEHALQAALNSHYVTISMDAGHKERYEELRLGGSWENLLEGINVLLMQRGNNLYPILDFQLIEFEGFEKELQKVKDLFKQNWPSYANNSNVRIRSVPDTQSGWREHLAHQDNTLCTNPWYSVSIKTNGDVVPCCHSFEDDPVMFYGNLNENSLEAIWNSDRVVEFRNAHRYGKLPEPCIYCTAKSAHNFHSEVAFDIIKISTERLK